MTAKIKRNDLIDMSVEFRLTDRILNSLDTGSEATVAEGDRLAPGR